TYLQSHQCCRASTAGCRASCLHLPMSPCRHRPFDRRNVSRYIIAIRCGGVHGDDLFDRAQVPRANVEGCNQLVPIDIAINPSGIRPIARETTIASATANIANGERVTRNTCGTEQAFMLEER